MNVNLNIVEVGELVDVWPGKKNAYKCKIEENGKTFTANVPKAVCELSMAIKALEHRVSTDALEEICTLANNYGEEMYNKAEAERAIDEAGEDI